MYIRLIQDLRFFIGLFFTLMGLMLIVQSFVKTAVVAGVDVNLTAGLCFVVFGLAALVMGWRAVRD